MKKILAMILALVLVIGGAVCVFADETTGEETTVAEGEEEALSAKLYYASKETDTFYVVFNKPVPAPGENVMLSLVAYGWPATDDKGNQFLRYGRRDDFSALTDIVVEYGDTHQVWKFVKVGHGSWMLTGDLDVEGPIALDPYEGGYWSFMLFGSELPANLDIDVYDNNFAGDALNGYVLCEGPKADGNTHVGCPVETVEFGTDLVIPGHENDQPASEETTTEPEMTEPEVDDTTAAKTTAAETTATETTGEATEEKGGLPLGAIIGICAGAAVVIAAVVIIIVKKKH